MKKLVVGILAHVDAGKTTLSESLLYTSGAIRKLGRVDNKDAYLDNNDLERERGITIFSKQAFFEWKNMKINLLDTPGHVDFSAEMERTLQVLDYAILVISGAAGVQGHTLTVWRLLRTYGIPTFIFVNKMDQKGTDRRRLMEEIKLRVDSNCIDFSMYDMDAFYDELAMCDETLMEEFLENGTINDEHIINSIHDRKVFPCFFGSALKMEGVEKFLDGFVNYTKQPVYGDEFGARVFKIARDEQDTRLTYLKITGGTLKVKMPIEGTNPKGEEWDEKINQIRLCSGTKFQTVGEIEAGEICAVTGLTMTYPGEGLGKEQGEAMPLLEPVLSYRIILKQGEDPKKALVFLKKLEEEDPKLHILWDETLGEIQVRIMGEVQLEVLKEVASRRFGLEMDFDLGNILYKESINDVVIGVGHFEPLRHYAEVHLKLQALPRGSGLVFDSECDVNSLERNWQRLILTHLEEKEHKGVLIGAPITDMKITVVAGRAHKKHTEGGDFREATYRAVRQGLMEAESIVLEPYYEFRLELPEKAVGRAMTDIEKMKGSCEIQGIEGEYTVITGKAPVSMMRNYQTEVIAYTKGMGRLFLTLAGYERCHDEESVIENSGYDAERDISNPTGSVFCAHGAGFVVPWELVKEYMHIESGLSTDGDVYEVQNVRRSSATDEWIGTDEVDAIIAKTFYANKNEKRGWKKASLPRRMESNEPPKVRVYEKKEEYLLVDGYNIIFAWPKLKELAQINVDAARNSLQDTLCNYQAIRKCNVIVVFDAYRLEGHPTEIFDYHNIHVVFTKEKETADQYIEKFVHTHVKNYHVTVATSDGLEQIIIRGEGAALLSAKDLLEEVERATAGAMQRYTDNKSSDKNYLLDGFTEQEISEMIQNDKDK
ncbi:MAG: TetM/TetW/TetO/TetS family tetracycline resistance ribosomal protection protein [Lachnospiraceae bacterium]|nr:TetM/TetW/TetO/TetS family tetracycline resistance ribosomal protection protein [Lachnospiraceae bacterium]